MTKLEYWNKYKGTPNQIAVANTCSKCKQSIPWTSKRYLVEYQGKLYDYHCFMKEENYKDEM